MYAKINKMYEGLKHAHSGIRWIFLIALLYAIFNAYSKWKSGAAYTDGDRKASLAAFVTSHIQLLIGLILYFISFGQSIPTLYLIVSHFNWTSFLLSNNNSVNNQCHFIFTFDWTARDPFGQFCLYNFILYLNA